jgi:pimeloyl-ACP methyl ester carboxylesterase
MSHHTPSRCEQVPCRGLRYNIRRWGEDGAPTLFLLHGWMDASASFQFVVDALRSNWRVIAPDWRGHGNSDWLGRPYWFPDYYADLDALLAHYSPGEPARLVGHSMGASIAATYAGVRPERVAKVVMMDFLGLPPSEPADAPEKLRLWLDQIAGSPELRRYPDALAFAKRLMKTNPRLTAERAAYLAEHVTRRLSDGSLAMACDPWHRVPSPLRYQTEDVLAGWRKIVAPVLNLFAADGFVIERFGTSEAELARRLACFRQQHQLTIADCGHNLQHDQPVAVAAAIEAFLLQD